MRRVNANIADRELAESEDPLECASIALTNALAELDYPQLSIKIIKDHYFRMTKIEITDDEIYDR